MLALSPLRVLFPRAGIVSAFNRHRRAVGVGTCVYGLLHLACHVLYVGDLDALGRSLGKPFVWFGLAGLTILVILAVTGNSWATRRLGGLNWKRLHRLELGAGLPNRRTKGTAASCFPRWQATSGRRGGAPRPARPMRISRSRTRTGFCTVR